MRTEEQLKKEIDQWREVAEFWRKLHERQAIAAHKRARTLWWLVVALVAIDFGQAILALTR